MDLYPEQGQYKLAFDKTAFRKTFWAMAARDMALQRYDRALAVQAILRGKLYERKYLERV